MTADVSVIVPAYNEAERIGETLLALTPLPQVKEVIVVDDGSSDATADIASRFASQVIRSKDNRGKGHALHRGWKHAQGEIIVFLDADLGTTATFAPALIEPVLWNECDMSIAALPSATRRGGFGFVKTLAGQGIKRLTGHRVQAPLSGQRAITRDCLENISPFSGDFGIEVNLTIEALRKGYRVLEVPVAFTHRESGRNWEGFAHRGRQFADIARTLYRLWRAAP